MYVFVTLHMLVDREPLNLLFHVFRTGCAVYFSILCPIWAEMDSNTATFVILYRPTAGNECIKQKSYKEVTPRNWALDVQLIGLMFKHRSYA